MHLLNDSLYFPHPSSANDDGIVAIGGDLSVERLILAYSNGIFPWFNEEDIPIWWSPDPRSILFTNEVKISKSMRNVFNQKKFDFTLDNDFNGVITNCRNVRIRKEGTWITDDIIRSFSQLHEMGLAHSVEVWQEGKLVGGLYGLSLGNMFFGESMFSLVSNSSKAAFIFLAKKLHEIGFEIIDCQLPTEHLSSLGAVNVPREFFLSKLEESMQKQTLRMNWSSLLDNKI